MRGTLVNEDELLVGTIVDHRYDVADVIGHGSTGTVFGGRHVQFPRSFAMKVLRGPYVSPDTVMSVWSGEASAAWSVTHPCLVEVFDAGVLPDGAPWFVMERLEGETLALRMTRERFSMASAVDIMMQLLAALDAVHARGLLMHDIRPQNLYLSQRMGCRPLLKVLDFGLSRLVPLDRIHEEWDSLRSVNGESDGAGVLAIPHYLSPERARGETELGPTSDLFSCGTLLYEMLGGQRPFASSSFNGLLLKVSEANLATPLSELRPDVPPELEEVVHLALSADPARRPESAREMQEALRAAFERPHAPSGRTSTAMPASSQPTGRHQRHQDRHQERTLPPHVLAPVPVPPPPTLRPPEIPIDVVDDEPDTSRGLQVGISEEEETRTMKLSTELLDRMRNDSVPPPTRRDTVKPPR